MRMTTVASAAILTVSAVALVQVGQAPVEQKIPDNGAAADDIDGNTAQPTPTPSPAPGTPSTALVNSAEGTSRPPE